MRDHLFARLFLVPVVTLTPQLLAQGTFQNLGFEAAQNIPVFDPQGHPWTMPASDALQGWTCYLGTNQTGTAWYNDVALDSAAVGILSSTSPYPPSGFVVGQYCLSLQYGVTGTFPQFTYGPAAIGQFAQLPGDAQSIRFRATDGFAVTFAGNPITLTVLSSQAGYNIYGGDISQFAGQAGELRITSFTHFGYVDELQFSTQTIPEPGAVSLLVVGLGLICLRSRQLRPWSNLHSALDARTAVGFHFEAHGPGASKSGC